MGQRLTLSAGSAFVLVSLFYSENLPSLGSGFSRASLVAAKKMFRHCESGAEVFEQHRGHCASVAAAAAVAAVAVVVVVVVVAAAAVVVVVVVVVVLVVVVVVVVVVVFVLVLVVVVVVVVAAAVGVGVGVAVVGVGVGVAVVAGVAGVAGVAAAVAAAILAVLVRPAAAPTPPALGSAPQAAAVPTLAVHAGSAVGSSSACQPLDLQCNSAIEEDEDDRSSLATCHQLVLSKLLVIALLA